MAPDVNALSHTVSPGYVASMGIRLVKGREFTRQDTSTSELVMVVDEVFARRYLTGEPLDVRLNATLDEERANANPWRVVGVVADVRHRSVAEPPEPEVYAPAAQMKSAYLGPQYLRSRAHCARPHCCRRRAAKADPKREPQVAWSIR